MRDPEVGDSNSYMKTRFLERIAHDLRGPCGVALGALDELESALGPELSGTHAKLISMTRKSTRKVLRLAQKLACAAEMSLGPLLDFSPVHIGGLAWNAAGTANAVDGRRGIVLEIDPILSTNRVGLVSADSSWIEMLLTEVIGNGLKHAYSKVVVSVEEDASSAWIVVTDDGRGPPPTAVPLFGPSQDLRGLGLSLAMGDRVARAHEGSLQVARGADGTTRVTLTIPRLDRPEKARAALSVGQPR